MIDKNNPNYKFYLAGIISESEYFDMCESSTSIPSPTLRNEVSDDGNDMLMRNLKDIIDDASMILKMLTPDDQLEEWMEYKISVSRAYISDIFHAFKHDKEEEEKYSGGCGM